MGEGGGGGEEAVVAVGMSLGVGDGSLLVIENRITLD